MQSKEVPAVQGTVGADLSVTMRLYKVLASNFNLVALTADDVMSITETLTSLADGATVLGTPENLTPVGNYIVTPLSTGSLWRLDDVGFNFIRQVPGALLVAQPGVRLTYLFRLADGTLVSQSIDVDLSTP